MNPSLLINCEGTRAAPRATSYSINSSLCAAIPKIGRIGKLWEGGAS